MTLAAPSADVLRAFGVHGTPRRLPGGGGDAWRVGDVVLKPGTDPVAQAWLGTEVSTIEQVGYRLPEVIQARDGGWVVDGWGAATWLPGFTSEDGDVHWLTVLDAGRAFHRAARALPRPDWLAGRSDWWAQADRAAWGERPMAVIRPLQALVAGLKEVLAPLGGDQLVHADLTGNVLVEANRQPGIIDISPYWRPAAYAEGIVVADAICWHDAPPSLMRDAGVTLAAVARGLLFRVLTTNATQHDRPDSRDLDRDIVHYTKAIPLLAP